MTNADTHPDRETRVLYNAACPICSAEIAHYADLARRSGASLNFEAIGPDTLEAWGLDEERATRRLHVLRGQELRSGVDAFIAMWAALPRWRWLAWLVGLPGLRGLAHLGYEHVAAPLLYRAHRRRQARLAYEPRS